MSKNNPAFPISAEDPHNTYSGLTVRQWMIGQVVVARGVDDDSLWQHQAQDIARIADIILEAEERTRE